jgi:hypothetical protein
MDFLDPAKKRAHRIRLFLGYILVAIAIAMGTFILLLQSYGYDIDRKTGAVIQNGLVFLSAYPEPATIYVNGEQKGQTDARMALPAAEYNFELRRDGYRTWKRTIDLVGGSVERLTYPTLFPEKLATKDLQLYAGPLQFATESPDRHWLVTASPGSITAFENLDISNPNAVAAGFSLPSGIVNTAAGAHTLELVEWSNDNNHLLIKHTFVGGNEFIMIDRQTPQNSFNINKLLAANPTKITLRDKKFDQWYVYDDKTRLLQVADQKTHQPAPLLDKVLAFKSYGSDSVLYVSDDSQVAGKVQLKWHDADGNFTVRTLPSGTEYLLDVARYSNHWYMVGGAKSEGRVYVYKDPQSIAKRSNHPLPNALTTLRVDQPAYVSFSYSTQFIMAQHGANFGVYDIETNRRFYYDTKLSVQPQQEAKWMDSNRLLLVSDGKTQVFDFDGTNAQTLVPIQAGTTPFFDRDYTYLFTIAPSATVAGRSALTSTSLKAIK